MLDKKIVELLNQQVNKEFYSAYLYLDFSNYYYDKGLNGFGNWYKVQAQEERDHAMLFIQYLQNNGEGSARSNRSTFRRTFESQGSAGRRTKA